MTKNMDFKQLLKDVGIRQKELAELSGVNLRQVQRFASGTSELENATVKTALAFSKVLHMTVEEMVAYKPSRSTVEFTSEADDLTPQERRAIIKSETAMDYSGWRRYPSTCSELLKYIPDEWWDMYDAKHIGEVMRLLKTAYDNGKNE